MAAVLAEAVVAAGSAAPTAAAASAPEGIREAVSAAAMVEIRAAVVRVGVGDGEDFGADG
jgi:hypothetical protein